MKILIDISHPAHWNFFKNAITEMRNRGYEVILTVLRRGRLPEIIKREYSGEIKLCGKYKSSKLSIIFQANILKFIEQLIYIHNKNINVAVSCGGFVTGAIFKFILRKPNIQFDDDPERKINLFLEKITSSMIFFPPIIKAQKKISIMNALKEWAYLSPKYFKPDLDILQEYNVEAQKYIFIREVSNISFNYYKQENNTIANIAHLFPREYKVIISLEDKSTINQYPPDWILLNEPVGDIHSLMYFSKMLISSGDSMAREGAMLGVPSIYCGVRKMAANDLLIEKGLLYHIALNEVAHHLNEVINSENFKQEEYREQLKKDWIDVSEFIINKIEDFTKG